MRVVFDALARGGQQIEKHCHDAEADDDYKKVPDVIPGDPFSVWVGNEASRVKGQGPVRGAAEGR